MLSLLAGALLLACAAAVPPGSLFDLSSYDLQLPTAKGSGVEIIKAKVCAADRGAWVEPSRSDLC